MFNYEHKRLLQVIKQIDEAPKETQAYSDWLRSENQLRFLIENGHADDVVIFASGKFIFMHSVIVSNNILTPLNKEDLTRWNFTPYSSFASYVMGGERNEVWIERGLSGTGSESLEDAMQLIFARTFDGWSGPDQTYFELHQEISHICGIHWRPERKAYCRYDKHGDLEPVVSITKKEENECNISLITFKWEPLEEYLAASDSSLVRMFDFTLFRESGFNGWPNELPNNIFDSDQIFFHQKVIPSYASYTRGIQILKLRRSSEVIFSSIYNGWLGKKNREYAEFIASDWRNNRISKISTDPNLTANYFNSEGNNKPFELSPAFFRPEVLLKYKADKEKYSIGERDISCRTAWYLKGFDVNEAGQVHVYICDLRNLPYEEQLHWVSFNEEPKAGISKRAFAHDFQGKWESFDNPLQKVLMVINRWHEKKVGWWTLRDEKLLKSVSVPLTESRDEWANAFLDLDKLVIEGFETKFLRAKLDENKISYEVKDKTISLLEKILIDNPWSGESQKLEGLRAVHFLRTKLKGHIGGEEAEKIAQDVIRVHETFGNHFQEVCKQLFDDLEKIER